MLPVTQKLILSPSKRRSGQKILGVRFLVAHDTGNDGSTALQNATYFQNSANDMEASAHYFVDDKAIYCCVPETEKAWHVRYDVPKDNELYGKDANNYALGVEMCFHSKNTLVNNLKSYQNYVELFASLCKKYNLDPAKDIVGHYLLDPARRTDPLNAFKYLPKTWEAFITDIATAMKPATPPSPIPAPVVVSNEDVKRQINQKVEEIKILLNQIK